MKNFFPKTLSKICGNCIHCSVYSHSKNSGVCNIKKERDYQEDKLRFDKNEYHHHPEKLPSGDPWPFIYMMSRNCFVDLDDSCDEEEKEIC